MKVSKKLVNSDFKNRRVEDPTRISSRQEKNVKKYVKEFFDKAVAKKKEHDKKKLERNAKDAESKESPIVPVELDIKKEEEESNGDEVMAMSDDENGKEEATSLTPMTPITQMINGDGLKRKREPDQALNGTRFEDDNATPNKRPRSITPPAPPPPPPPIKEFVVDDCAMNDTDRQNGESSWNGDVMIDNETLDEDEQVDVDHQPPPPPPPPIDNSIQILYDEAGSRKNASHLNTFKSPPSPISTEDDIREDDDGDLNRTRTRYLKAQESV